jgi:hypothetical protein
VRKLWTARLLTLLAAGGLAGVVIEERRQQVAEEHAAQRISVPAGHHRALEVDGIRRPPAYATSPYLHWSAERPGR